MSTNSRFLRHIPGITVPDQTLTPFSSLMQYSIPTVASVSHIRICREARTFGVKPSQSSTLDWTLQYFAY